MSRRIYVKFEGKYHTLTSLATERNINPKTLYDRWCRRDRPQTIAEEIFFTEGSTGKREKPTPATLPTHQKEARTKPVGWWEKENLPDAGNNGFHSNGPAEGARFLMGGGFRSTGVTMGHEER
jgi:hypothetical protein